MRFRRAYAFLSVRAVEVRFPAHVQRARGNSFFSDRAQILVRNAYNTHAETHPHRAYELPAKCQNAFSSIARKLLGAHFRRARNCISSGRAPKFRDVAHLRRLWKYIRIDRLRIPPCASMHFEREGAWILARRAHFQLARAQILVRNAFSARAREMHLRRSYAFFSERAQIWDCGAFASRAEMHSSARARAEISSRGNDIHCHAFGATSVRNH